MKSRVAFILALVLITSIFFDIVIKGLAGFIPDWLPFIKIVVLIAAYKLCRFKKNISTLSKFSGIMIVIIMSQIGTSYIAATSFWKYAFDVKSFTGNIGSSILLKSIGIIPILIFLFLAFKNREEFYFNKGDLSIKADKISWLGIDKESISWGKLSLLSAVLISIGTIILTVITATGFSVPKEIGKLPMYLPVIIFFALCNSFCEGIVYRNAILGTLKDSVSKKYVVLIAAIFFGIGHYYGVPSGAAGAVMSSVLGWYMCRSMYETNGLLSSWIIHFMQDAVIFSTLCLFW